MLAPSRHRHRTLPTLALLALVALGLMLQPLASAMGELHGAVVHDEWISTSNAGHVSVPHDDTHIDHDDAGLTHALLHMAHCCGHSQGLPTTVTATLPIRAEYLAFALPDTAFSPPCSPVDLRPPIRV